MTRIARVFISYAREDYVLVSEIYRGLEIRGYRPWMDKSDIVGGEDWERAIVRAVRGCDFFIFCASAKSVNKRGPIQREIKEALNLWQEKLEDDIFFIPVRLEPCEVPDQIRRFQWIDYFIGDGMREIERSITAGLSRLAGVESGSELRLENRSLYDEKSRKYEINLQYPELQPAVAPGIAEINAVVSSFARKLGLRFKKVVDSPLDTEEHGRDWPGSCLELSYNPELVSDELVVYRLTQHIYLSGAAHGNSYTHTFNFTRRPFLALDLDDVFHPDSNYLSEISKFCVSDLLKQAGAAQDEWISNGAGPNYENLSNFLLKRNGVLFVFDPYQVGSYAEGRKEVLMPLDACAPLLDPGIRLILEGLLRHS